MSFDGGQGGRGTLLAGLVVVSLLFLGSFYVPLKLFAVDRWPQVEGRAGKIVNETFTEFSELGTQRVDTHNARVAYKFVVSGVEYRGQTGVANDTDEDRAKRARMVPPDGKVTVRYDPDDPKSSELVDPGASNPWWLAWSFPFGAGLLFAFAVWKFKRSSW